MNVCGTLVRTPERANQVYFTDDAYTRYFGFFTIANAEKINIGNIGKYRLGAVSGYYSMVVCSLKACLLE